MIWETKNPKIDKQCKNFCKKVNFKIELVGDQKVHLVSQNDHFKFYDQISKNDYPLFEC